MEWLIYGLKISYGFVSLVSDVQAAEDTVPSQGHEGPARVKLNVNKIYELKNSQINPQQLAAVMGPWEVLWVNKRPTQEDTVKVGFFLICCPNKLLECVAIFYFYCSGEPLVPAVCYTYVGYKKVLVHCLQP